MQARNVDVVIAWWHRRIRVVIILQRFAVDRLGQCCRGRVHLRDGDTTRSYERVSQSPPTTTTTNHHHHHRASFSISTVARATTNITRVARSTAVFPISRLASLVKETTTLLGGGAACFRRPPSTANPICTHPRAEARYYDFSFHPQLYGVQFHLHGRIKFKIN